MTREFRRYALTVTTSYRRILYVAANSHEEALLPDPFAEEG